jgi:hypothetical protein
MFGTRGLITAIPQNGMPGVRELHSDLIPSASLQSNANNRCIAEYSFTAIVCDRQFTGFQSA